MGSKPSRDRLNATGQGASAGRARQRAFLIGIDDGRRDAELEELAELLLTAGVAAVGEMTQAREEPDPDRYFGRGKLSELERAIKESGANLVACDDELAPRQERNLEALLGVPVIDRTAIILDIFAAHAHSAEGKLQVELAQLEYNLARMRGLWTHLERLGAGRMDGGIGTRGPGESQIETDRRLARDRIVTLRRRLARSRRNREVMRARRDSSHLPRIALAGYTNAGKSTLMAQLTGAEVKIADQLFHTLDPMTRGFEYNGRGYLLTDTVGFIEKLPHQLVESFKATLEETIRADLILHVLDATADEEKMARRIAAVDEVLEEIEADDQPRLLVLNKIDQLSPEQQLELEIRFPDAISVSARTGAGVENLLERIEQEFEATLQAVEMIVPYEEGGRLSQLHELAGKLSRDERIDGVHVRAKLPKAELHRFRDLLVSTN